MKDRIQNILLEAIAFKDRPNINDAFWKWFKSSKAVDKKGEPLILFHGTTNANFSQFDRNKYFQNIGYRYMKLGSWFTPKKNISDRFTKKSQDDSFSESGGVFPVYLSIQNPKIFKSELFSDALIQLARDIQTFADENNIQRSSIHYDRKYEAENVEYVNHLIQKGYDGIILKNTKYDSIKMGTINTQYCVFESTQIKSIFNRGTWNPNVKDISK